MPLICWGSFALWLLTSSAFLEKEGMIKADVATGAILALMSSGCFIIGSVLQRIFFRVVRFEMGVAVVPLFRNCVIGLIVTLGLLAILVSMMVAEGGIGAIADSISGSLKGATVPGVTTLVHICTALPPLCLGMAILLRRSHYRRWSYSFLILAVGSLVIGGLRAYLAAERISLLVPALASIIVLIVMLRRNVIRRILAFAIAFPLMLLLYFVASESIRSFRTKVDVEGLDQGVWEYNSSRFLLYYATSVNGGIAEYRLLLDKGDATPVFYNTLNPLYQVLEAMGIRMTFEGRSSSAKTAELIEDQLRLVEFTNTWGFSTPWSEGHLVGASFWILWGAISTWLYRRMCNSGSPLDIAPYAIVAVGLFDSSRVLVLGAVHCLVPLAYLLFLRRQNCRRVRSAEMLEWHPTSEKNELVKLR